MAQATAVESCSPMSQNLEVTLLKEKYNKECKVIKDVGDFCHVIIIRPADIDVAIKFQLSADYPDKKPQVITRSETIAVDCLPEIEELVEMITTQNKGCPVIDSITQKIIGLLRDKGLDTPPEVKTADGKKSKQKRKKPKNKANNIQAETFDEKKSSMKTADDVINRIQWDENLPTDSFVVGYLDRFTGIQERKFSDFSWEDLASADYDVLAIPKHRIQYFKYKDVIVWDKNKRLDNVFGSTGGGISILDIMENYDNFCTIDLEKNSKESNKGKSSECKENDFETNNPNRDECGSDDDVQIDFGPQPIYPELKPEQWRADDENVWQDKKARPTHFLCLRITDEDIKKHIQEVQEAIIDRETRYVSCCPTIESLHITLCTLGLDNMEQIVNASHALENAKSKLEKFTRTPLTLNLEGIDNFHDTVIYAKVRRNDDFMSMVREITSLMNDSELAIRDSFDFMPHLTIMKVTCDVAKEMKSKRVRKQLYKSSEQKYFGKQIVDALYLCEMSDQRQQDGFYHTTKMIYLNKHN